MVIYEMNQKGAPMVISENGIVDLWVFLGFIWEKWYLFLWFWYYF
jgi:hypothetical protein